MFCPECGADNRRQQQYCRNCGVSLRSVFLAIEGRVDEASNLLTNNFSRLSGGIVTILIFTVIALISSFIDKGSAIINLLLGLAIGGPLILSSLRSVQQAVEMLSNKKDSPGQSETRQAKALSSIDQVSLADGSEAHPGSIAEPTTAKLKVPVR